MKRTRRLITLMPEEKEILDRAASLYGLPLATYIRVAALDHGRSVLKNHNIEQEVQP